MNGIRGHNFGIEAWSWGELVCVLMILGEGKGKSIDLHFSVCGQRSVCLRQIEHCHVLIQGCRARGWKALKIDD